MRTVLCVLVLGLSAFALSAQAPQDRNSYSDKSGTTGHTLVVNGKNLGPYSDVEYAEFSRSGTATIFLVDKKDKKYVVANGKEFGPLPASYDADTPAISNDGSVWTLTMYQSNDDGDDTYMLLVNGKSYGPFVDVYGVQMADKGGNWIAEVQTGEDEYKVLQNGKAFGPFQYVVKTWVSPDGSFSGYSYEDDSGTHVVLPTQTYDDVDASDFDGLNFLDPHWAYAIHPKDADEDMIVLDGKPVTGYTGFGGLVVSPSGRHYAFAAQKIGEDADTPVIVVDGKEFVGESPYAVREGSQEYFFWTLIDGAKVTLQSLALQ